MGVSTDLEKGRFTQQNLFQSFLICDAETAPISKLFPFFSLEIRHIHIVQEPGLSVFAEWILSFVQEMGVSTDLEKSWSTQQNLFLSFLICDAKTAPISKLFPFLSLEIHHIRIVQEAGLSAFAEWILSFVQEMGVSTDLEKGWSTQQNLFVSLLICEAKTGFTIQYVVYFFFTLVFVFVTILKLINYS